MNRFIGKRVLVTGGASGIGEATADRFLREGAHVVVLDRSREHLDAAAGRLRGSRSDGAELVLEQGDVASGEDVDRVVGAAVERLGGIDVLVSNAGIAYAEPFLDISRERWDETQRVNLTGMFVVTQRVAREMVRAGGGTILLTSSTNGLVGEDRYAHYNASKGGVTLLTKSVALELAPLGVRVNSVHPGFIETPMVVNAFRESENENEMRDLVISRHPLGRLGMPREIADAIVFLASDESSFMTGAELVVDGGYTAA
jgi:NAD(P)-dependent dehydrogenase (short-subunit alcohol dehydrogenase family)